MEDQTKILKEAFGFQDQLTAYAYVVLQDWSLAEDVVQDLFVTVSVKWQSFDQSKSLYPWLKRIVRNRAVDIIRSRSKEFYCEDSSLLALVDRAFDENELKESLERKKTMSRALRECIDSLGSVPKALIKGFYVEGKSCIELAADQKRSENAIYISLTRIRQKLRKCADSKISVNGALR
ncbi:MAG: sigma-70 family RNA polymerase sigma factor [Lentisphaeraceae bacterium]|nr:sigma-70 family RNA polymerase sigma factor [Lentisphaeraceae bacterium]